LATKIHLTLTDALGQIVYEQTVVPASFPAEISINSTEMAKGIYILTLESVEGTRAIKLIK
jgi:hypothetical protein